MTTTAPVDMTARIWGHTHRDLLELLPAGASYHRDGACWCEHDHDSPYNDAMRWGPGEPIARFAS